MSVVVTIRMRRELVEAIDEEVEKHQQFFDSRAHFIKQAVRYYLQRKPYLREVESVERGGFKTHRAQNR